MGGKKRKRKIRYDGRGVNHGVIWSEVERELEERREEKTKNVKINGKHGAELMDTFKNRRHATWTPASLLIKSVS